MGCGHYYADITGDTAFAVDTNALKYGSGVLREIGDDAQVLGMTRIMLLTDRDLAKTAHVAVVCEALGAAGVDVVVYDEVAVEPTDTSFLRAAAAARDGRFNGYVAVGGGSVIDTAKAANLYATYPADLLEYVNPPIGRGKPVPGPLPPLIACPTTSGTGSECTPIAIFDYTAMHAKTGIVSRRMRPALGLVDPDVTSTLPSTVVACSGFDVLSHAVESFTALPYTKRAKPAQPRLRPASQGANPYSDVACTEAMRLTGEYIVRAVNDPKDTEARERMMFASTLAGIGFGNAGCHAPHGMSYSVSGLVKSFHASGYPEKPLVPHGMSVVLNSPAVFRFTAHACPERHLEAARLLGADASDVKNCSLEDAGRLLASAILRLMKATHIPNGLQGVGYAEADIPELAKGAFPQHRLLKNAPCEITLSDLEGIYRDALRYW
ncbi:hydroxyacid-oxoacid transhydrogenase [Pendulispora albinea]|uniref:hydroxyacid-oxoacid transhydrogenase n=1 Tax=Pendulispora albinea TaxID=2741071 RepID=A0ABZ2LVV9_9BACT